MRYKDTKFFGSTKLSSGSLSNEAKKGTVKDTAPFHTLKAQKNLPDRFQFTVFDAVGALQPIVDACREHQYR